jgi:17beta-estradiol 17-dehydrogenase / very-long-chain 3-oxoacyl-CoA reductase
MDKALQIIGAVAVTQTAVHVGAWVYRQFLARSDLQKLGAKSGVYAVITGASDGIGKGLAEEGAERGFNLVLIARSKDKLEAIAKELREKNRVDVKILVLDLGAEDVGKTVKTVMEFCKHLDVSVLINNVGTAGSGPVALEEQSADEVKQLVHLNTTVLAALSGDSSIKSPAVKIKI